MVSLPLSYRSKELSEALRVACLYRRQYSLLPAKPLLLKALLHARDFGRWVPTLLLQEFCALSRFGLAKLGLHVTSTVAFLYMATFLSNLMKGSTKTKANISSRTSRLAEFLLRS